MEIKVSIGIFKPQKNFNYGRRTFLGNYGVMETQENKIRNKKINLSARLASYALLGPSTIHGSALYLQT